MSFALVRGALLTGALWAGALSIALSVGTLWGVLRSRVLYVPFLSPAIEVITFVLRAVPVYVQLLIVYFIGNCGAYSASSIALGFCSAAYVSQSIRAGIDAISHTQWDAARVLGFSSMQTVRFVVLPQVIRIVLPALSGECDQVLKSTALVSTIGVMELTGVARNSIARDADPLGMYMSIAVWYVFFSLVLYGITRLLERRYAL